MNKILIILFFAWGISLKAQYWTLDEVFSKYITDIDYPVDTIKYYKIKSIEGKVYRIKRVDDPNGYPIGKLLCKNVYDTMGRISEKMATGRFIKRWERRTYRFYYSMNKIDSIEMFCWGSKDDVLHYSYDNAGTLISVKGILYEEKFIYERSKLKKYTKEFYDTAYYKNLKYLFEYDEKNRLLAIDKEIGYSSNYENRKVNFTYDKSNRIEEIKITFQRGAEGNIKYIYCDMKSSKIFDVYFFYWTNDDVRRSYLYKNSLIKEIYYFNTEQRPTKKLKLKYKFYK